MAKRGVMVRLDGKRDAILAMRRRGAGWDAVAQALDVSRPVLLRERKRLGIEDDVSQTELAWRELEGVHGEPIEDVIGQMHERYRTWARVAIELGVTRPTLFYWRRRLGMAVPA